MGARSTKRLGSVGPKGALGVLALLCCLAPLVYGVITDEGQLNAIDAMVSAGMSGYTLIHSNLIKIDHMECMVEPFLLFCSLCVQVHTLDKKYNVQENS